MKRKIILLAPVPLGLVLLFSGCNFPYIVHSGIGELHVLTHTVPMDRALNDPKLSPADREKLLWVRQVRQYAQDVIGLKAKKSYLSFYDTRGRPAVWNLSASRKDALQPYSWSFPVAGKFNYLGYFDKTMAERKAAQLEKKDYDTVIYGALAYSTAGWFTDPLFSSLLKYDKSVLAETVIHELTHNTVFMKSDSEFNESVANFVGRTGALEFIAANFGKNSNLYRQTVDDNEDRDLANEFLAEVYRDLDAFYRRTDLSSAEKIARRNRIFRAEGEKFKTQYLARFHHPDKVKTLANLPVNNARILLNRRYNQRTDLFEKVYQACGCNLKRTVGIFAQAAASRNAWRYLQDWLIARPRPKNM